MPHERHVFYSVLGAKTCPKLLFGVPKARILRAFRSEPWLPRRIQKTIVFYGEIRTFVGRRKRFLPPTHLQNATNVSAKSAPLAGVHPLRKPSKASKKVVKYAVFAKADRRLEKLVKYVPFGHQKASFRGPDASKREWRRQAGQRCNFGRNIHRFLKVKSAKGDHEATGEPEVRL